ncbi:extracellular solute-binding protein [Caldalkalibacillus salinus]|uniref:extracellular solute-binding protein n=1 Tax=Caldalkalibacillus salinus TaxID=2803787 RepID=UPI0019246D8B|nr:extracellular solute-binding protein [Caldalkalibacillus salinus]
MTYSQKGSEMMKKLFILILSMLCLVALAACQTNESTGDGEGEKDILTVWVMGSDEYWRTYHDNLIAEYMENNENVQVDVEYVPWSQGENQLVNAAANQQMPDVSTIAGRWTAQLASMGAIESLDAYFEESYPDAFVEAAWQTTQYQDQTWGIPVGFTTTGLFYRQDWLTDAGFEAPPATWEEFEAVAEAFTEDDRYGFGLVGTNNMETTMFWAPFLWTNGGKFLSDDLTEARFNQPEGVEALEFYVRLFQEGWAPEGSISNDRGDSRTLFLTGAVGMTTQGPWLPKFIRDEAPDMDYGIAPYPQNKVPANLGTADHIVMSANANNKPLAWDFIDFFTNEENDLKWAEFQGFIPYRKANLEQTDMKDDPDFAVFFDVAHEAISYPTLPEWPQIDQAIAEAMQQALMGTKTPQQALDEAAEKVNDLLAEE